MMYRFPNAGLLTFLAALFFLTTVVGYGQSKGIRGDTIPQVPPLDEAAIHERIESIRAPQPGGDYRLDFELRHMPRRKPTTYYNGKLWGSWSEQGPLYRIMLWPADGRPEHDAVQLIIAAGSDPQCWILNPGEDVIEVTGSEWYSPVMPGLVYTPADLAMTFFDWPIMQYAGSTRVSGRNTHLIDFDVPDDAAQSLEGLERLRLALDANFNAPVRVEWTNRRGDILRSMNVVDFRKVDEQWIAGSIDMLNTQTRARDRFEVRDARFGLRHGYSFFLPEQLVELPSLD